MTRTIFTNANLIDGSDSPPRPGSTIVIAGNRVVHIGSDSEGLADSTSDGHRFDLAGKTVMPGMVLGHYHAQMHNYTGSGGALGIYSGTERPVGVLMAASIQAIRATLMTGITGIVSAGCSDELDVQLRMAVDEGFCEGPRIVPASHFLESTGYEGETVPFWRGVTNTGNYRFADGADEFRKLTRDEIRRGAEIIKIQPTAGHGYPANSGMASVGAAPVVGPVHRIVKLTSDEVAAVVEAAHGKGRKVRAHVSWREQIEMCIELGVDIIDHGDEIDAECLRMMAERGTYWVPSLTFLRRLVDNERASSQNRGAVQHDYDNVCKMLSVADEAGVRVMPGDDWGLTMFDMPHKVGAYTEELELWVRDAGIAPQQALRWATVTGASLLGVSDIGTLEPGNIADLLVVDGDPSSDISILRDPANRLTAIMKDGVFVKNELDAA